METQPKKYWLVGFFWAKTDKNLSFIWSSIYTNIFRYNIKNIWLFYYFFNHFKFIREMLERPHFVLYQSLQKNGRMTRIELATPGTTIRCSNQLSYIRHNTIQFTYSPHKINIIFTKSPQSLHHFSPKNSPPPQIHHSIHSQIP